MNDPLPVTVVIPVLNEERNLPGCLDALGNAFTEIVAVDSGSADRTCEIAEQSGATVLPFRWDGRFPKKRNWTLRRYPFKTPWVLFLDADEQVTPEFIEELRRTLPGTSHAGFRISFTNWFMGRPLHHGDIFRKPALFRVGSGEYEELPDNGWSSFDMEVHEHPVLNGSIGTLKARIQHHDFRSIEHYIAKHREYAVWEARRYLWLKSAPAARAARLTRRQRIKYALVSRPGFGFFYFCVSCFLKGGFLDGLAGYRFIRLKWRYFDLIRSEIKKRKKDSSFRS